MAFGQQYYTPPAPYDRVATPSTAFSQGFRMLEEINWKCFLCPKLFRGQICSSNTAGLVKSLKARRTERLRPGAHILPCYLRSLRY
jgi:hypothetical protein